MQMTTIWVFEVPIPCRICICDTGWDRLCSEFHGAPRIYLRTEQGFRWNDAVPEAGAPIADTCCFIATSNRAFTF
jgi:hypothetical protein